MVGTSNATAVSLLGKVQRALWLGNRLCVGLGHPINLTVRARDPETGLVILIQKWVGNTRSPEIKNSGAHNVGLQKLLEVQNIGIRPNHLVMSPQLNSPVTTKYMGSVRMVLSGMDFTASASHWKQEHDKLLAILVLYDALLGRITLHHTGFRYPTQNGYNKAREMFPEGRQLPARDHQRWFTRDGDLRVEFQWFPEGPYDFARHWDIITKNPAEFLEFIAQAFNTNPKYWEVGPNDPIGMVRIPARSDGSELNIMARGKRWKIPGI
jgi:hypothetical protein